MCILKIVVFLLCYIVEISIAEELACSASAAEPLAFRILTGTVNSENIDQYAVGSKKILFYVKTSNEAEISLNATSQAKDLVFKIILGREGNRESVIRKYDSYSTRHFHGHAGVTPNLLKASEYRGFWISLEDQSIAVGKIGEKDPFISKNYSEVDSIWGISFSTPIGHSGEWIINEGLSSELDSGYWCETSGVVHSSAVKMKTSETDEIYVCRMIFDNRIIPGYATKSDGRCIIRDPYTPNYELLFSAALRWKRVSNKIIPADAVVGGWTLDQKPVFICRFKVNDRTFFGNVVENGNCWSIVNGQSYFHEIYYISVRAYVAAS